MLTGGAAGAANRSVRGRIADALHQAARTLAPDGELPDLELGRAKAPDRGEYASSAAMKLARVLRQAPQQIASRLAETIVVPDGAATVEVVDGYVNFRLTPAWLGKKGDLLLAASRSLQALALPVHSWPASDTERGA